MPQLYDRVRHAGALWLVLALALVARALAAQGTELSDLAESGWHAWLSPGVILTVGFFLWREIKSARRASLGVIEALSKEVGEVKGRLGRVEQELLGYDKRGGLLDDVRAIEKDLSLICVWMAGVGQKLQVPFDRRAISRDHG